MADNTHGAAPPAGSSAPRDRLGFRAHGLGRAAVAGWLWSLVSIVAATGLSLAVFLVTSRALDPVDFGLVALAVAIVALVSAVMPIAFGEALVQRQDLEPRHLNSVFWLSLGVGAAAYALLWIAAPWIAQNREAPELSSFLRVLGAKLVLDALSTVPGALLQRRMEFRAIAIRSMAGNALGAALCLVLVYAGQPLWGLVLSQVLTSVVTTVVAAVVARWLPDGGIQRGALRDVARFGLYTMGGRVLNDARIDQLLFGLVMGPAALGLYFFARRIYQLLLDFTAGAFVGVSSSLFASLQSQPEKSRHAFEASSFAATAVGFPVFTALLVLAPTAVPLVFGTQWTGAVVIAQSWSVIGVMASLGVIQGTMIRNLGDPGWWFRYQTGSQVLGWLVIVALAPFGADVVMLAFALRTCVLWPLSVRKSAAMLDMEFGRYVASFAAPAVASALAAATVLALPLIAGSWTQWAMLGAQLGLGSLVYAGMMIVLARSRLTSAAALLRRKQGTTT